MERSVVAVVVSMLLQISGLLTMKRFAWIPNQGLRPPVLSPFGCGYWIHSTVSRGCKAELNKVATLKETPDSFSRLGQAEATCRLEPN